MIDRVGRAHHRIDRLEKQLQQLAEGCALLLEAVAILSDDGMVMPGTAARRIETARDKVNGVRYPGDEAEEETEPENESGGG